MNKITQSRKGLLLFNIISILFIAILVPDKQSLYSPFLQKVFIYLSIFNLYIFLNYSKKINKSWLRFDVLFLLGYFIVSFQIPLLDTFGITPLRGNWIWINKGVVNYATWLSALAILVWMLGFYLYTPTKNATLKKTEYLFYNTDYIQLILLILFFVLVGNDFLSGSYNGTGNWGTGAVYINLALKIFIFLRIIHFFYSVRNRGFKLKDLFYTIIFQNKLFTIIVVLFYSTFLFAGDRGPIIQLGLAVLGSYSVFFRPIKLKYLLILIVAGSFVLTIMGYGRVRDTAKREGGLFENGIGNYMKDENKSAIPTDELASSIRILYRAINIAPSDIDYLYGTTMFSEIIGIIPFGGSFYVNLVDLPYKYKSSASFFTYIGQGDNVTYGEGSEYIADIYINFGTVGVIIFLFVFGYFVSYLNFSIIANSNNLILIIVYIILLTTSIYFSRASFFNPLKMIIWSIGLNYLISKKIYV